MTKKRTTSPSAKVNKSAAANNNVALFPVAVPSVPAAEKAAPTLPAAVSAVSAIDAMLPLVNQALEAVYVVGVLEPPATLVTSADLIAASDALVFERDRCDKIEADFKELTSGLHRSHLAAVGLRDRFLKPAKARAEAWAKLIGDFDRRERERVEREEREQREQDEAAAKKLQNDEADRLAREAAEAEAIGDTETAEQLADEAREVATAPLVVVPTTTAPAPRATSSAQLSVNVASKAKGRVDDVQALLIAAAMPVVLPQLAKRLIDAGQREAGVMLLEWATELPAIPIESLFEVKQAEINRAVTRSGVALRWPGVAVWDDSVVGRKPGVR